MGQAIFCRFPFLVILPFKPPLGGPFDSPPMRIDHISLTLCCVLLDGASQYGTFQLVYLFSQVELAVRRLDGTSLIVHSINSQPTSHSFPSSHLSADIISWLRVSRHYAVSANIYVVVYGS